MCHHKPSTGFENFQCLAKENIELVYVGQDAYRYYCIERTPIYNLFGMAPASQITQNARFSDLSKKITMQNLFHDGGFSTTGISEDIIEDFS